MGVARKLFFSFWATALIVRHADAAEPNLRGAEKPQSIVGAVEAQDSGAPEDTPRKCSDATPCNFLMIADLDCSNRQDKGQKLSFESCLTGGKLVGDGENYRFEFDETSHKLVTKYNEGGRGGEFSELATWKGGWFTADDRTGIVFEINKQSKKLLPRFIFNEGDGKTSAKGFKIEWMAEKDGKMYFGSHGNLRPDDEGVLGHNLQWVMVAKKNGKTERIDWTKNYQKIHEVFGAGENGYVIHEAIEWSEINKQWFVLPRRVSTEPYSEAADVDKGTNKFVVCSEDFSSCDVREVNGLEAGNLKGFGSFKFVPGSNDKLIAAIRTVEDNEKDLQESWVTVFTIDGKLIAPEVQVPKAKKLEGFTFL